MPASLENTRMGGRLTQREFEARYQWLADFFEINRFAPTYREVADGWGISLTAASDTLEKFENWGWISFQRQNGRVRPGTMRLEREIDALSNS
ncbi:MAG: hypothetical protein GF334_00700 [Candidatus Altiarchaeales archaeon]|nr:hypothetical protein [Candidatus Altiarchaeales archaeon]